MKQGEGSKGNHTKPNQKKKNTTTVQRHGKINHTNEHTSPGRPPPSWRMRYVRFVFCAVIYIGVGIASPGGFIEMTKRILSTVLGPGPKIRF